MYVKTHNTEDSNYLGKGPKPLRKPCYMNVHSTKDSKYDQGYKFTPGKTPNPYENIACCVNVHNTEESNFR